MAPLITALGDSYWRVRVTAAWALGELGERKAAPELIRLCRDPNGTVRAMAAEQLGRFQAPEALEPLLTLVADPEPDVQWAAVNALGGFCDERCLGPLRQLLQAHAGEDYCASNGHSILNASESAISGIEEELRRHGG